MATWCARRNEATVNNDQLLALLGNYDENFVERKPDGAAPGELRQTGSPFANSLPEGSTSALFISTHDENGAVEDDRNLNQLQKRLRNAA